MGVSGSQKSFSPAMAAGWRDKYYHKNHFRETFGFFGDLTVIHDGADGQPAELELDGWLVGYDDGSPDTETGILFLGTSENGAFLNPGVYD